VAAKSAQHNRKKTSMANRSCSRAAASAAKTAEKRGGVGAARRRVSAFRQAGNKLARQARQAAARTRVARWRNFLSVSSWL